MPALPVCEIAVGLPVRPCGLVVKVGYRERKGGQKYEKRRRDEAGGNDEDEKRKNL